MHLYFQRISEILDKVLKNAAKDSGSFRTAIITQQAAKEKEGDISC